MKGLHTAMAATAVAFGCSVGGPCLAQGGDVSSTNKETAISTSVCALYMEPERFANKVVTFEAQYITDRFLEILVDRKCGDSGAVVPFGHFSPDVGREFVRALGRGCPGTNDKVVRAVWTGTFRWDPNSTPGTGRVPRWLEVTKIDHLQVEDIPNSVQCHLPK